MNPPVNWNGVWNGNNIPWVPCRLIAMGGIPSRHMSRRYTVGIAYTELGDPTIPNPFGFSNPGLGRLLMWVCGPRNGQGCRAGARTVSPCLHVLTALHILGVLAHNPREHRSRRHRLHILDAGDLLPSAHGGDIAQGFFA